MWISSCRPGRYLLFKNLFLDRKLRPILIFRKFRISSMHNSLKFSFQPFSKALIVGIFALVIIIMSFLLWWFDNVKNRQRIRPKNIKKEKLYKIGWNGFSIFLLVNLTETACSGDDGSSIWFHQRAILERLHFHYISVVSFDHKHHNATTRVYKRIIGRFKVLNFYCVNRIVTNSREKRMR